EDVPLLAQAVDGLLDRAWLSVLARGVQRPFREVDIEMHVETFKRVLDLTELLLIPRLLRRFERCVTVCGGKLSEIWNLLEDLLAEFLNINARVAIFRRRFAERCREHGTSELVHLCAGVI